jgi:hypothetical protein
MFGVVHRNGSQPMSDIRTHWKVTNLSQTGLPAARLLTARLVKPRLRDTRLANAPTESTNAMVVSVDGELIPRGYTRELDILFFVAVPPGRLSKPMKLKIVVVDQLSNEHKLPPVTLMPQIIETTIWAEYHHSGHLAPTFLGHPSASDFRVRCGRSTDWVSGAGKKLPLAGTSSRLVLLNFCMRNRFSRRTSVAAYSQFF